MDIKVGDIIWFPSVSRLVNKGKVEEVQGPYIKVKADGHGAEYIMSSHAFPDREGLMQSKAYQDAWTAQWRRRNIYNSASF